VARRRVGGFPASLLSMSWSAFNLGLEAQAVVGLRLFQVATGNGSTAEVARMMQEKVETLFQAQQAASVAIATGRGEAAASRVLSVYRRRVRANRKRLSG
jgi:thioredoxin-like negative regulator of GroEL